MQTLTTETVTEVFRHAGEHDQREMIDKLHALGAAGEAILLFLAKISQSVTVLRWGQSKH